MAKIKEELTGGSPAVTEVTAFFKSKSGQHYIKQEWIPLAKEVIWKMNATKGAPKQVFIW